jgi:hypothetical protein
LAPGSLFEVRAVDAAGNRDLSPAIFSWVTNVQDLLTQQPSQQQQPQQSVSSPPIIGTEPLASPFGLYGSDNPLAVIQ